MKTVLLSNGNKTRDKSWNDWATAKQCRLKNMMINVIARKSSAVNWQHKLCPHEMCGKIIRR